MTPLQRFLFRAPITLYRLGLGPLLGRRFLLLEHRGRSSGLLRKTVLEILETGTTDEPVVASGFGEGSQWYKNVVEDPDVWITRGRNRTAAVATRLDVSTAEEVFERYRENHPRAARVLGQKLGVSLVDDLENAARTLPLFRLVVRSPVRLSGPDA